MSNITNLFLALILAFGTSSSAHAEPSVTAPSKQAIPSDRDVVKFVELGIERADSVNYGSFQTELKSAQPYFDAKGWRSWKQALKDGDLLKSVEDHQVAFDANIPGGLAIAKTDAVSSGLSWKISVPVALLLTEHDQEITASARLEATVETTKDSGGMRITDVVWQTP